MPDIAPPSIPGETPDPGLQVSEPEVRPPKGPMPDIVPPPIPKGIEVVNVRLPKYISNESLSYLWFHLISIFKNPQIDWRVFFDREPISHNNTKIIAVFGHET